MMGVAGFVVPNTIIDPKKVSANNVTQVPSVQVKMAEISRPMRAEPPDGLFSARRLALATWIPF